jgi:mRNA interferase MazF
MAIYSRGDVVLVRYPFSDLTSIKVRPAVIVHSPHPSEDCIVVPLTSQIAGLLPGEFELAKWQAAGLHVPTAVKRGIYTIHQSLIVKTVRQLAPSDLVRLSASLQGWVGF